MQVGFLDGRKIPLIFSEGNFLLKGFHCVTKKSNPHTLRVGYHLRMVKGDGYKHGKN
jgi:hypothetical protein